MALSLLQWLSAECETFTKDCVARNIRSTNQEEAALQNKPALESISEQLTTSSPSIRSTADAKTPPDTTEPSEPTLSLGVAPDTKTSECVRTPSQTGNSPITERTSHSEKPSETNRTITCSLQSPKEGNNNTCLCKDLSTCKSPGGTCLACRQRAVPNGELSRELGDDATSPSSINCDASIKHSDTHCQDSSPDSVICLSSTSAVR